MHLKQSIFFLAASICFGQSPFHCDLKSYKEQPGLHASLNSASLEFTWDGERGQQLRASFTIREGIPMVEELAIHKDNAWIVLGRELTPEYDVVSGRRRLSEQQMAPLRGLKIELTPEVVEHEKWNAFWDAPLMIPGNAGGSLDLPRKPEEIHRAAATYHASGCLVHTDGARLEVTFPESVAMGIFNGALRYTVYRRSNLLRQEVIAATSEDSVAYKYNAGLKGFSIEPKSRIVWRDTAQQWQQYRFGGAVNQHAVPLVARNRLAILETGDGGSLAVFPPPHKFFFSREIETNLGYVYYRKDSGVRFAMGARMSENEQPYRPYGLSDEIWDKRAHEARHQIHNFALYNAPPGTEQHMPVYFYLSASDSRATDEAVLAYTHHDTYKPLPGFQVLVSHFHFHFNEQLTDLGTLDTQPSWASVFRALGVNIAILADFHSDSHPADPGPIRFKEQEVYFEGCRRVSDDGFLMIPGEEPDATLGGHYMFVLSHPVYWSHAPGKGQTFEDTDARYGKVFHTSSPADELRLLNEQDGLMWQTHPRTKGSAGYPDAVKDWPHFKSDRFLGGSYQSLPVDQSEKRMCEKRCFGLLDDMNNWAGTKTLIAEGDTYMKYPDDETYPELEVNYVKLDRVPKFDEPWTPLLKQMRAGEYFISSGEILFHNWSIEGKSAKRTLVADIEFTFPLEFAELVWGDGSKTGRQIIPATSLAPFGRHTFRIPFDATGKKWVRFAVWDSAGNGAFLQPVHLQ